MVTCKPSNCLQNIMGIRYCWLSSREHHHQIQQDFRCKPNKYCSLLHKITCKIELTANRVLCIMKFLRPLFGGSMFLSENLKIYSAGRWFITITHYSKYCHYIHGYVPMALFSYCSGPNSLYITSNLLTICVTLCHEITVSIEDQYAVYSL